MIPRLVLRLIARALVLLGSALILQSAFAALAFASETKTPPKGISFFYFRNSQINLSGEYLSSGAKTNFDIHGRIDGATLNQIAPASQAMFAQLQAIDPALAASVDFGKIDLSPRPELEHRVFAFGHGVTDRLMLVGVMPLFEASVEMRGGYNDTGSVNQVVNQLRSSQYNGNTAADLWAQVLSQFPQLSGSLLQSVIVNEMGYRPLGSWTGSGVGDVMVYGQYLFLDQGGFKQAVRAGTTAPTGHQDDPDNLVDIPFGDGYWAPFAELVNEYYAMNNSLRLNVRGKYIQPLPAKKTYRLYEDPEFPLSSSKATLGYRGGASFIFTAGAEYVFYNEMFSATGSFAREYRQADSIDSVPGYDVSILEKDTQKKSDSVMAGIEFSSIGLFQKKKFPLPIKTGVYYAKVIGGVNTADYDAYVLDFTMLF